MISYLYLYGALTRVAFRKLWIPGVYKQNTLRWAAVSGLITTSIGTIVAFVPSRQVESVWRFEFKMVTSCVIFIGLAAGLFIYYSRRIVKG